MMNVPKISIVVPSYNQGRYLEATLRSVIDQNYPNVEIIVIDGGSTDNSVDIIRRYEQHLAYWVSEPDGGQTKGLIKGFQHTTGDIQCWLNSDDLQEPNTLAEVAKFFTQHPDVDAVYGDAIWIDADDRPLRVQREIPYNRFIWLYTYNYIPCMSMFWRKSIYDSVGGLDARFDLAMDADLWARFADVGRISHLRRVWSRMRFYPEQKNRRLRERSDEEDLMIRERYWGSRQPSALGLKRAAATGLRGIWRGVTGCYGLGYRRYMETLE